MLRILVLISAMAFLPAAALAQHDGHGADADRAAIEKAVFDYFHGLGAGDSERLKRAFAADHAMMVGVVKNEQGAAAIRSWKDMNEVIANWTAEPTPEAPEQDGEILDMHVQDGRLATVVFRFTDEYYDSFILTKIGGEWKILAKGFVSQKP